jgi:glycosyltransferase involved in cell wall biosynthesis
MRKPFFSIITPVLNGQSFIDHTIKSVINQNYKDFEYIIIDGGSTDKTKEIITKYGVKIDRFISEKDSGMYDAIKKGFDLSRGKYFLWLNSDDFLINNNVLNNIKNYLVKKPKVEWLVGKPSYKFESIKKIYSVIPYKYPQWIIQKGFAHNCGWGFIQQESTVFSNNLYQKCGGINTDYKMASDYYLWKSFSNYTGLETVNIHVGVQRKWKGQLQNDLLYYYKEIKKKKCHFSFLKILRLLYSLVFFPITYFKK